MGLIFTASQRVPVYVTFGSSIGWIRRLSSVVKGVPEKGPVGSPPIFLAG